MPPFDIRTAYVANTVGYAAVTIMVNYVWMRRRTYPGFGLWILGCWIGLICTLFIALRGGLPDFVSIVVGNSGLLAAMLLLLLGMEKFMGNRPRWTVPGGLLAGYSGALTFYTYGYPSLRMRIIIISMTMFFLSTHTAARVRRGMPGVLEDAHPLIFWALLCFSLTNLARVLLAILAPPTSQDFLAYSASQAVVVLVFLFSEIFINIGVIVLNGQRLERDLRQAVEECRVLRGFIPICSRCKKIRDEDGHWDQLETYFARHTDAKLSHGYCPECAEAFRAESRLLRS